MRTPLAQLDRVPGYEPGGYEFKSCRECQIRGCSLTVELQPSKLITGVRLPSPAPHVGMMELVDVRGLKPREVKPRVSSSLTTDTYIYGEWNCLGWLPVLQTGKQMGSNPIFSTLMGLSSGNRKVIMMTTL